MRQADFFKVMSESSREYPKVDIWRTGFKDALQCLGVK